MNRWQFLKVLRARWITVCVAALVPILCAVLYSLLQTPLYQASTRLYVSTTAGSSVSDLIVAIASPRSACCPTSNYSWAKPWRSARSTTTG